MTRNPPLIALIVCVALCFGCGKKDDLAAAQAKSADSKAAPGGGAKPAGLPVKAAHVVVGNFSTDLTAVGTLLADESVIIRSEIDGRVVSLPFQEGQAVKKGAPLVTLDNSELEAGLAAAKADQRTETSRYDRARGLFEKAFISQEALDVARNNMERAKARVQQEQARLAKTVILAPFDGTVGLRLISPGAYVKAGEDIVRLEKISAIKLDFRVPETHASRLKKGQDVAVAVDAYPADRFTGRIYALEPVVDERSRTVLARAQVPNEEGKLKPGMFARVIVLLENRPGALIIPEEAIVPLGKDAFVYRIKEGGATEITQVQIGARRPGQVEIISGLSAEDQVVTEGAMKLQMMPPGTPVSVMAPAPADNAAQPKT
jgi:membrane fusion protein, multidrug efflux system